MTQAAPVVDPTGADGDWQRLDPRMLLVHPVREVGRFLLPLVALFAAGTVTQNPWQYLAVVVPVAVGLLRYLTTSYRIAAGRVELRHGLLSRHLLSTPVERVRSVDLTASPVHRLLGLTTVRIGTGTASTSEGERLDLDGLPVVRARALRAELLRAADPVSVEGGPVPASAPPAATFHPAWLRFAPFTSSGLVIAAALVGVGSQLVEILGFERLHVDPRDVETPWGLLLLVVAGVLLVAGVVLSVVGYLVTNGGFRLWHEHGAWHVSRGLLTTRETSLDDDRVAGVSLGEPLGLRVARGARLSAIATGLRSDRAGGSGGSGLVPPAPRPVVDAAAVAVGGSAEAVHAALRAHGPAAVRRRWLRALVPALLLALVLVLAVVGGGSPWLLLAAALVVTAAAGLAADRARALGHLLVDDRLVARSGSLLRRREVLHTDHVIGWTFRATWWQRRAGLTSLVATTAGGRQQVTVLDVPEPVAVELAVAGVPGLVEQFCV